MFQSKVGQFQDAMRSNPVRRSCSVPDHIMIRYAPHWFQMIRGERSDGVPSITACWALQRTLGAHSRFLVALWSSWQLLSDALASEAPPRFFVHCISSVSGIDASPRV